MALLHQGLFVDYLVMAGGSFLGFVRKLAESQPRKKKNNFE